MSSTTNQIGTVSNREKVAAIPSSCPFKMTPLGHSRPCQTSRCMYFNVNLLISSIPTHSHSNTCTDLHQCPNRVKARLRMDSLRAATHLLLTVAMCSSPYVVIKNSPRFMKLTWRDVDMGHKLGFGQLRDFN